MRRWHPKNKYQGSYDFESLISTSPELKKFVLLNAHDRQTIDFSNPIAVRALNKSLLKSHYNINHWDLPADYLCPPIPGRAEYIHHVKAFLDQKLPNRDRLTCLDIGTGASLIYSIIAVCEYDWDVIAVDIDKRAIMAAQKIIDSTPKLSQHIKLSLQQNSSQVFKGVVSKTDQIDVSICNPPFHSSKADAEKASLRKHRNLHGSKPFKLNFGGKHNELWCQGGELGFIRRMIKESKLFSQQVKWFSCLVSKASNVNAIMKMLESSGVSDIDLIELDFGNKKSRIVLWTY